MTAEPDPLPPDRFIGDTCSFDHEGKRLVGKVESKVWVGYTSRGHIPNYHLTVRGQSGKTMVVDMWATRAIFR